MKNFYFILLLLFCTYVFFGWKTLDPDFGWHIRIGQLIVSQGIPRTDPFSFTMMKYPFVDHEWLTNVCIFLIYGLTNNTHLLSFFFGLIAVISLYKAILFNNNMARYGWFVPALVFLIGSSLFGVVGIRPQVWGWLLFVFWVNELRKGPKASLLTLCFLQLLWVNTHGSFFLGAGTYIMYIISEYVQRKEIKKYAGTIVILFLVTFINPHGWRAWWEVWMQLSDSQLRFRIQEWQPGIMVLNFSFWFYCVFFISLFIKNWRKIPVFEIILSLFFFLCSLSSVRNMSLFLLVSVPVCTRMWFSLEQGITKEMKKHFMLIKNTLIILFFIIGLVRIGNQIIQINPVNKIYPANAVSFLIQHKAKGRIYAEYDWGGYIIWKAQNLKVFIDGRMPSWRWKQNDLKQSNNSAEEYFLIASKYPPFEPYRRKYNINYALIRKDKKKNIFIKYKKIYEDELSVIYQL